MRTYDEVNKILLEIGSDTFNISGITPGRSTEDIVSILLNIPLFEQQRLEYYNPIRSDRKIIGRAIVFFKRVVRKVLTFLVLPIVHKQNAINAQMSAEIKANQIQLEALRKSLTNMQETIKKLEAAAGENEE